MQYDSFTRLADRHIAEDGSIYAHGPISYGVPGPKLIREIFEGIPHNLVIKTPKYAYQNGYRIIGSRPVESRLLPDENHPGCKIEKYDHTELDLSSSLADFSWMASVPSLEEAQDGLIANPAQVRTPPGTKASPLPLPHPNIPPESSLMLTGVPVK